MLSEIDNTLLCFMARQYSLAIMFTPRWGIVSVNEDEELSNKILIGYSPRLECFQFLSLKLIAVQYRDGFFSVFLVGEIDEHVFGAMAALLELVRFQTKLVKKLFGLMKVIIQI
jgi:hypothetical protein